MTENDEGFMHISYDREFCVGGEKHNFEGWKDLKDEEGNIRGGTTVCSRCGLDAMTHSLRYGP